MSGFLKEYFDNPQNTENINQVWGDVWQFKGVNNGKRLINLIFRDEPQTLTIYLQVEYNNNPTGVYFRVIFGHGSAQTTKNLQPGIHTLAGSGLTVEAVNPNPSGAQPPPWVKAWAVRNPGSSINWTEV